MTKNLDGVSTYFLVLELTGGGHMGLLPELEPIDEADLLQELNRRTNQTDQMDVKMWARWFLGNSEHGTELERANFLIFLNTIDFDLES